MDACIGLGANLDDPAVQVARALAALREIPQTRLIAASSLYRSAPVDCAGQSDFINAVARIDTLLAPRDLLDALHAIERGQGRVRTFRNAPRTLDLDLLVYGDRVVADPDLVVPHPRLHERLFVLEPLLEVSPECVVPGLGPAATLLERLRLTAVAAGQRVERVA